VAKAEARVVVRLMSSDERRPVNIGNPVEYTVREIAEMVIELSGSGSGLVHGPLPEDDPKQRSLDITRAREALCSKPRVSAEEGLTRTTAWFTNKLGRRRPPLTTDR